MAIKLENGIVFVECEIEDQELYEIPNEIKEEERCGVFIDIIKVGVAGYKRMKVSVELDFVEKRIDDMLTRLEKFLDPHLETSHLGVFMSKLKEYFDKGGKIEDILDHTTEDTPLGKFVKSLKEYFDSGGKLENLLDPDCDTSPIGKFNKKLDEYLGRGGKLEELLNPAEGNSPLGKLKKEILEETKEIRDLLQREEGKRDIIDSTTLKGYEFEDACEEILSDCVEFGGSLERMTDQVGNIQKARRVISLSSLKMERRSFLRLKTGRMCP